jgi:hypothetical protein
LEIADFELERYFAKWEFNVAHLLCASDPEPLTMRELLALADPEAEELWRDLPEALDGVRRFAARHLVRSPSG